MGNVCEFGLSLKGGKGAVLAEIPTLSAFLAEDLGTLGVHFGFGLAMGALIEHLMQSLGAEGLGNENALVLLILIIIVNESLSKCDVDLVCAHCLYLISREKELHFGAHGHLSLLLYVPNGGVQVISVVDGNDYGHLVHFDEGAQGVGKVRGAMTSFLLFIVSNWIVFSLICSTF